jgi:hypothetical protein
MHGSTVCNVFSAYELSKGNVVDKDMVQQTIKHQRTALCQSLCWSCKTTRICCCFRVDLQRQGGCRKVDVS